LDNPSVQGVFQRALGLLVNQVKALMEHGDVTCKGATFGLDIPRYCDFIEMNDRRRVIIFGHPETSFYAGDPNR
jgi:hypothetical protein